LVVAGDLFYGGTLLKAYITVSPSGQLEISQRDMIMNAPVKDNHEPVQFRGD
jgi:hypothetical protein